MSRIVFWFRYVLNCCWNRGRSSSVSRWCSSRYPSAASTAASSSSVSTGYAAELAHQARRSCCRGRCGAGPAVDERADLLLAAASPPCRRLRRGRRRVSYPAPAGGDRLEVGAGRLAARLGQRRAHLLADPPGPGDLVVDAAQPLLDLAVRCLGDTDLLPHRLQLAVQPGQFGRRRLKLALLGLELLGPVDHGLPVDVGELAGLVEAGQHLTAVDRGVARLLVKRPARRRPRRAEPPATWPARAGPRACARWTSRARTGCGRRCGACRPSRACRDPP